MATTTGENPVTEDIGATSVAEVDPNASPDDQQTGPRVRKLTTKGDEQYRATVEIYYKKLDKFWEAISRSTQDMSSLQGCEEKLRQLRTELSQDYDKYNQMSTDFSDYLARIHTEGSCREAEMFSQTRRSQDRVIQSKLSLLQELIADIQETQSIRSRRTQKSEHSGFQSSASQLRAKALAAKARVTFSYKEAEMKKRRAALDADLELLAAEKDLAAAEAEASAAEEGSVKSAVDDIPREIPSRRTADYVKHLPSLNALATPFVPPMRFREDTSDYKEATSEVSRLVLKRDLLINSLTTFNDDPAQYNTWKVSFRSKVKHLELDPLEEMDLLVKWTGPESRKQILSLKASNTFDPQKGLDRIWERLDERYGSPETIESTLKRKLNNFPRLTNKEPKKLYELSDLVSEIESLKEDPEYCSLLGYFDSSSGVTPIVNKLPYNLQERWTTSAIKYMERNHVHYPPFSHFAQFLREQSKIRNNPSFAYNVIQSQQSTPRAASSQITSRKTDLDSQERNIDTFCHFHNASDHSLNECKKFRSKPFEVKRKFLQDKRMCFRCCSTAHRRENCQANVRCGECKSSNHVTALHCNFKKPSSSSGHGGEQNTAAVFATPPDTVTSACAQICGDGFEGKSCAKVLLVEVHHRDKPGESERMYALLDDQSNRSLARPRFFEKFPGSYPEVEYSLSSCAGIAGMSGRRAEGFVIRSLDGTASFDLPVLTECSQIPNDRDEIPTPRVTTHFPHLRDVSIPEVDQSSEILLLIGRDLTEAHHVLDQRIGPKGSPYAQKLHLGWVVVGETCLGKIHRPKSDTVSSCKTHVLSNGRASLFPPCPNEFVVKITPNVKSSKTFTHAYSFDTDQRDGDSLGKDIFIRTENDEKEGLSVDDRAFLEMMDREFVKDSEGNWTAPLPFRHSRPALPNNRAQALKRAEALHTGLLKDPVKREHFMTFMKGILDNRHAEVAPELDRDEECWYLPLFGVYHPKKPEKIRGVFDSSAMYRGVSLNQVLLKGPDLNNSLLGVLLRFRQESIAITADIEQMFYCFAVREDHRNFLRFLWYKDNDITQELIEYRMTKHVFGNSPSPAVATYGLRRTAQETETEFGSDMRDFIDRNFYVDDGLTSTGSPQEAVDLMTRTRSALQTAGIRLHKIASNSREVIEAFPSGDLAGQFRDLDMDVGALPAQLSLGLCWDLENDTFTFKMSDRNKPFTRRGVLSTINSVYDPLGFLAPVTIRGKILLRDMVAGTKDWDDPISEEFKTHWDEWESCLHSLTSLQIPRTYHQVPKVDIAERNLHVYSDASEKAISAVAYMRTVDSEQNSHIGFVMGKSKVAPKQGHTIPRLELCAAGLAVELAELVCDELCLPPETVTYYTDSKVVLGYLKNETRRFYVYVANRVAKIRRFSSPQQWFYVSTQQNPADNGTRFVQPALLGDSPWLQGPQQLLSGESKTEEMFDLVNLDADREVRADVSVYKSQLDDHVTAILDMDRASRFSSMTKLVNAVANLRHIAAGFKLEKSHACYGWHVCSSFKTVDSLADAETTILKAVQGQFYGEEIDCLQRGVRLPQKSAVSSLSPILNKDGILCVGGRLRNADVPLREKNPVLIPGKHHVAVLLIRRCHERVRHQGRHITEGAVRESGFWITGGKRLISSIIHECVTCRKLRGSVAFQKMSELPADRLQPGPPFTSVGVDCFGPWQVTTRRTRGGQANSKRWAVLFTCLATRAVHIELLEEMSSSSFINALKRFVAIRGKVKLFRSDRGTNFIGATDALGINPESSDVKTFLLENGTRWIFNPPHSSHMGGVWERMIGVTRRLLDSLLLDTAGGYLTHEVLSTFLAEVSAIINSRPLVPLSSDPENPYPLSPSLILTHKSDNIADVNVPSNVKDLYRAQYKRVQLLADMFWKRWRGEFLQTLQARRKWKEDQRNLQEGDVVVLKDKTIARNSWPTGVLTKVLPSADGKVRAAEVRVIAENGKPAVYIRPINEFVVLIPSDTV